MKLGLPKVREQAMKKAAHQFLFFNAGVWKKISFISCMLTCLFSTILCAQAERLKYPIAVFSGLDKITGHIVSFKVPVGDTYQFGSLQVTPQVCYANAAGQASEADAFVEIKEITLEKKVNCLFDGWMFADSPGLNALEHPIYDVWFTNCVSAPDDSAPQP